MNEIPIYTSGFDVEIIVYLLINIFLLFINIVGYRKIPFLLIIGGFGSGIIVVPTLIHFNEYYVVGLLFFLINMSLCITGLTRALKQESK